MDRPIHAAKSHGLHPTERVEDALRNLGAGDTVLVNGLSRVGESLGQVMEFIHVLVERKIRLISAREGLCFVGNHHEQGLTARMVKAFAEAHRELVSERTKSGLATAKARGKLVGRPKGSLGASKLDGREDEIRTLLKKGVSMTAIAKITDVSRPALYHFIRTRKLAPRAKTDRQAP